MFAIYSFTNILTVWQTSIETLLSYVPSQKEKTPSYLFFFPTERKMQWKTMLYIQLWIMNLNQFNNPTKGCVCISFPLSYCISWIHPLLHHIHIYFPMSSERVPRERARDGECSWRLPPPGNYVTPWFNSSWHFPHCTFCSSSKYILLRKRRHLSTTQDNRGNGCSWSCVDLKQKQKQKTDKQNVGTCPMRSPEHKKVGSGTSKVPGVSLQTLLRRGRGFIFHF